ncbi:YuiB family protein [Kurthia sibirica]|uniref:YuiB family protein n=1 Tax=Kurthia sibirica TaxID=202750 RepID=A0A2U3AI32_9BACL|nr:YuiB family protein [Kurthia sibirica]PWI24167.1 hypothetical protein DEX24_14985 [Kurthia sibirica]GEK34691.1 putative membrane protein YuiB [Kurthia sibirica]
MGGSISIIQLVLSILIFVVLFFGIGFLLNMLLRVTWLMAFIYPIIVILIIDKVKFLDYFFQPGTAFPQLWQRLISLQSSDVIILASGLVGAIISGIVIKLLRKNGYQMF